jgi:hypothetical protein
LINKGVGRPNANLVDDVAITVSNFYPIILKRNTQQLAAAGIKGMRIQLGL